MEEFRSRNSSEITVPVFFPHLYEERCGTLSLSLSLSLSPSLSLWRTVNRKKRVGPGARRPACHSRSDSGKSENQSRISFQHLARHFERDKSLIGPQHRPSSFCTGHNHAGCSLGLSNFAPPLRILLGLLPLSSDEEIIMADTYFVFPEWRQSDFRGETFPEQPKCRVLQPRSPPSHPSWEKYVWLKSEYVEKD